MNGWPLLARSKQLGPGTLVFQLLLKLFDAVAIPEKSPLSLHAWASKTALAFFSAEANKGFCQAIELSELVMAQADEGIMVQRFLPAT
jgi:hypothetical protein